MHRSRRTLVISGLVAVLVSSLGDRDWVRDKSEPEAGRDDIRTDVAFRQELAKLKKLHLDGVLTTEEFRAASDKLLNPRFQEGD